MRQRRRGWSKCLALTIALVVAGAACGDDDGVVDDGASTVTTEPDGAVTSTVASTVDYSKVLAPRTIGTGFIAGTSRDGSAVYVEEEDPMFPEPGCEGQPAPVLFRLPIAGGDRQLLATKAQPVRGRIERASNDKIAVVGGCEEFLSSVYVGSDTSDGNLGRLTEVDLAEGSRPASTSLTWSADGSALLGADNFPDDQGTGGTPVLRLDPVSGEARALFAVAGIATGVAQVAELADGTYAVAGGGRVQLFDGAGTLVNKADGNGFALSPDRKRLAVWGTGLSMLVAGGVHGPAPLVNPSAGRQITSAEFSPDGRAVAYVSSAEGGNDNRVELVVVDSKQVVPVVGPGPYGRVYFTGDGKALVMNRFQATPANTFPVTLVRFE